MSIRQKIIEVARQELGMSEPRGDDKYITWYNSAAHTSFNTNVSWCFIFVSWVLRMAEVDEDIIPNFASCGAGIEWAKKNKCWKPTSSGYVPSPADLIIFDWGHDGKQDHVGLVTGCDPDAVYTIEGNTSNKVAERIYEIDSPEIMGYIAVPYSELSSSLVTYAPPANEEPKITIADVQIILKTTFKQGIQADNIWGPKSKKALIKSIQKALNDAYRSWLMVDGVWGPLTEKAWKNISKGCTGNLVMLVQIALVAHGYDVEVDGIFGKETQKTVKEFQKANALKVDGIVGRLTMSKLVK